MARCSVCRARVDADKLNVRVACEKCREAHARLPEGIRLSRCQCGKVIRGRVPIRCESCE
jgi:hypothetical protein